MIPLVPVTTDSARRLHYAREDVLRLDPSPVPLAGRIGMALCGHGGFDQARYDAMRSARPCRWKPIDITSLPACKTCHRAANH